MIESLSEHGVLADDLVPALMTTHTVKNPEFDPEAKREADQAAEEKAKEEEAGAGAEDESEVSDTETEVPPPYQATASSASSTSSASSAPRSPSRSSPLSPKHKSVNPFGEDDEDEPIVPPPKPKPAQLTPPAYDDEGDIGTSLSSPSSHKLAVEEADIGDLDDGGDLGAIHTADPDTPKAAEATLRPETDSKDTEEKTEGEAAEDTTLAAAPMPSLPGVSTSLTNADETVTLDIRWTVVSHSAYTAWHIQY